MAEYTLHKVYASICNHAIRHSSRLSEPDTSIEDTIQFCANCEISLQLEAKHESAKAAYEAMVDRNLPDRKLLRRVRNQYIATKVALLQQEDRNRCRLSPQRRDSGLPGSEEFENKSAEQKTSPPPERAGKSVRFDDRQDHRTEGQKRSGEEFLRGSHCYSPGRWADRSGQGFINTSNPYPKPGVEERINDTAADEAVEDLEGMVEGECEGDGAQWEHWEDQGREDDDLELLTDEQLQERFRQVQAQLAKLREQALRE